MTRYSEQTYEKVYEAIENRLDKVGLIQTNEIYGICGKGVTVSVIFRDIMDTMVKLKKAIKIKQGEWEILKPNKKQK